MVSYACLAASKSRVMCLRTYVCVTVKRAKSRGSVSQLRGASVSQRLTRLSRSLYRLVWPNWHFSLNARWPRPHNHVDHQLIVPEPHIILFSIIFQWNFNLLIIISFSFPSNLLQSIVISWFKIFVIFRDIRHFEKNNKRFSYFLIFSRSKILIILRDFWYFEKNNKRLFFIIFYFFSIINYSWWWNLSFGVNVDLEVFDFHVELPWNLLEIQIYSWEIKSSWRVNQNSKFLGYGMYLWICQAKESIKLSGWWEYGAGKYSQHVWPRCTTNKPFVCTANSTGQKGMNEFKRNAVCSPRLRLLNRSLATPRLRTGNEHELLLFSCRMYRFEQTCCLRF